MHGDHIMPLVINSLGWDTCTVDANTHTHMQTHTHTDICRKAIIIIRTRQAPGLKQMDIAIQNVYHINY